MGLEQKSTSLPPRKKLAPAPAPGQSQGGFGCIQAVLDFVVMS